MACTRNLATRVRPTHFTKDGNPAASSFDVFREVALYSNVTKSVTVTPLARARIAPATLVWWGSF